MLISGNLPGSAAMPARPPGTLLVAAVDVEWSKNYRIRGGNIPFCYSAVWLSLPQGCGVTSLDKSPFWYTAAYVQDANETRDLVGAANKTLTALLGRADLIAGHQLSRDLAVLAAAGGAPLSGVAAARTAWHE